MTASDAQQFEQAPFFEDTLKIRKVDEAAKELDFKVLEKHWAYFEGLLNNLLQIQIL